MIYIIIPVFNRWLYTKECLASIEAQEYKNFRIIVVDHGSTDGTTDNIMITFPNVEVLKGDESMWWTAATNFGIKWALSKDDVRYILTLNNDLIVKPNYLSSLITVIETTSNTIVGSMSVDVNNPDDIYFAGTKWDRVWAKYYSPIDKSKGYKKLKEEIEVIDSDLLPGRGTLFPVDVFRKAGIFDEKRFPHYMADEEMVLRARKYGYVAVVSVKSVVYSYINATGISKKYKRPFFYTYLKDSFVSIKSPNNLSVRWRWSKNAKFPVIYFFLDFCRVLYSLVLKSLKNER